MNIQIVSQREFEDYKKESKSYFFAEEYTSEYFQRFLLKNNAIKQILAEKLRMLGVFAAHVEIKHNADNPQELMLVVTDEIYRMYTEDEGEL